MLKVSHNNKTTRSMDIMIIPQQGFQIWIRHYTMSLRIPMLEQILTGSMMRLLAWKAVMWKVLMVDMALHSREMSLLDGMSSMDFQIFCQISRGFLISSTPSG
jgi:hypothetical protein